MSEEPKKTPGWPSWRYGPDGACKVFDREEDAPAGWEDHPSKVAVQSGAAGGGGGSVFIGAGGSGGATDPAAKPRASRKPKPADAAHPAEATAFNGADPAAFDHDGDGKPGGSKPDSEQP